MIRSTRLILAATAVCTLTFSLGCDKPSDEQQKANVAQAEANKAVAEANKEAVTKTTSAQLEADKKIAAAEGDFAKRREDYRHKIQVDLVELDKKIDLLEAKAKSSTGKTKTDLDQSLAMVRTRRSAFNADLTSVESVLAVEWDNTKARVDKDWNALSAMVDNVK